MDDLERVDAIVVGANLCGLVTTYLLDNLGFRVLLLERGAQVGGANSSFTTADGSTFDLGMHVLDDMRSELTTRLLMHAIDGRAKRVQLKRGMVLRGETIPYNATPEQFPASLRELLPSGELVDKLQPGALPTRELLRESYGAYADFVFDEVLPAYRCELRHRELGVDESALMANIYPWLFPRAARASGGAGESRNFHDRLRSGEDQYILYPEEGGFAGFAMGFLSKFSSRVEVLADLPDLRFELERETHRVEWIEAKGRKLASRHVFWCARWPQLCKMLELPSQDLASDNMMLGSFRFNEAPLGDFNEILVADADYHVDRVSFPGRLSGNGAATLQLEFAFPAATEGLPLTAEYWRNTWTADLKRLGILSERHSVESFDYKCFRMHYNSFGAEGEARREPDPSILHPQSNIRPVAPTLQNRNLNGSVPLYIQDIARFLADHP